MVDIREKFRALIVTQRGKDAMLGWWGTRMGKLDGRLCALCLSWYNALDAE
jgi:hypothetical protein